MRPRVIGFLFTLRCTATCRHCCFKCNPRRTEKMSLDDALFFVREVAGMNDLSGISLTGGEPFREYEDWQAVLGEGGANSLKARIVTNCFWATDTRRANEMLAPLIDQGLSELSVSYDQVHQEFVPREHVSTAVKVALDLGLKVVISTTTLNGNIADYMHQVQNDLALPPHEHLYIMPGYIAPNGRALECFPKKSFCYTTGETVSGKRLKEMCPHVIREPIITPSGDVAVCCSPSTATLTGFVESFVIGNLHEKPLKEILIDLENDLIFNIIMLEGPWALYQLIKEKEPTIIPDNNFVNICDLCFKILNNPRARDFLNRNLKERGIDLIVKKLYLEALADGNVDDYFGLKAGVFRLRPQR